jgi:hypothetical protein
MQQYGVHTAVTVALIFWDATVFNLDGDYVSDRVLAPSSRRYAKQAVRK